MINVTNGKFCMMCLLPQFETKSNTIILKRVGKFPALLERVTASMENWDSEILKYFFLSRNQNSEQARCSASVQWLTPVILAT
jgi:hypothetical protein